MFGLLGLNFLINDAAISRLKGEKGIAEKGIENCGRFVNEHKESIFLGLNPGGYLITKSAVAMYNDVKENGTESTTVKVAKLFCPALNFLPEAKPQNRPKAVEYGAAEHVGKDEESQKKQQKKHDNIYTVNKGDCLYNIAKSNCAQGASTAEINAKMKSIMDLNGLKYESDGQHVMIRPGDKLKLAA